MLVYPPGPVQERLAVQVADGEMDGVPEPGIGVALNWQPAVYWGVQLVMLPVAAQLSVVGWPIHFVTAALAIFECTKNANTKSRSTDIFLMCVIC